MKKTIVSTNTKATATPQPEPPAGPGPRATGRVLKTTDLKRAEDSPPNLNQAGGVRTSGIDDANFVHGQATPEELAELRARIERRQAPAPNQPDVVLVCTNPKCRAWSAYPPKHAARSEGGECIFCNPGTRHDGGRLRAATPAETEMFWADKKRREEIWRVRVRQQAEIERERSRLGLDRVGYLSIDSDPSIKRGRG